MIDYEDLSFCANKCTPHRSTGSFEKGRSGCVPSMMVAVPQKPGYKSLRTSRVGPAILYKNYIQCITHNKDDILCVCRNNEEVINAQQ